MTNSVFEKITNKIIEELEKGVIPWKKSWKGVGLPMNGVSNKHYNGINMLLLFLANYSSPYWFTYNQVKSLGGNVKEGEKATPVIFWKFLEKKDKENEEVKEIPILKYYNVFNVLQTEGLDIEDPVINISGIKEAELIKDKYINKEKNLELQSSNLNPFYSPKRDIVNVPTIENFRTRELYYSTLFHELVHSTGHKSRLDRGLEIEVSFGSESYSNEELIAELGACFLSGIAGIETEVIKDSASYIDGWLKVLKADAKLLVYSGSKAQKAVDYILNT